MHDIGVKIGFGVFVAACIAGIVWGFFLSPGARAGDPDPTPSVTAASTPDPTPSASPSPPASPTASDTPTPSATPTEEYTPETLPTGNDLQQVVQTILNIRNEAFLRGDPTILGEIYDSQCRCSTTDGQAIRSFTGDGLRYEAPAVGISNFSIRQQDDPDAAVVTFDAEFPVEKFVNADGEVVEETDAETIRFEAALLRGARSDDRWVAISLSPTDES